MNPVVVATSAFLKPMPVKPTKMSSVEIAEEVEWLLSFGYKGPYICAKLGRSEPVLNRALQRAGRLDLWHKMFADREPDPTSVWANKYIKKSKAGRG